MARSTQKFDVAEWYKRAMILIMTVLIGIIAQDMSEMKGDVKVALKMVDFNHAEIQKNEEDIEDLVSNVNLASSERKSHDRRLKHVEGELGITMVDIP